MRGKNLSFALSFDFDGLYGWIEEWFKRGMQETPKEMSELWLGHKSDPVGVAPLIQWSRNENGVDHGAEFEFKEGE